MIYKAKNILERLKTVCTAGGSAIAEINALEERGFRGALMRVVYDSTERANELRSNGT